MADLEPRMVPYRALTGVMLIGVVIAAFLFVIFPGQNAVIWRMALAIALVSLALGLYALLQTLLAVESHAQHMLNELIRVGKRLEALRAEVTLVQENILLSDAAKGIAFRDKDRDALRNAIEEEINRSDWEAATSLIDQMEDRFGYREEASHYRQRIETLRAEQEQQELAVMLAKVDDLLAAYDWDEAKEQVDAVQARFPDDPRTQALPDKLDQAKNQHKKWLLQQWDQAVQRDAIDRGIEILKELDKYLDPSEVAALDESARGVFRTKLHNLGVQFSLLVTEKLWRKALEVGEEIIREFPNSRMAEEIRERLAALKSKAETDEGTQ